MSKFDKFQVVSDEEISFFLPLSFGDAVNNDIKKQREVLVKGCDSKLQGYHVGQTVFKTLVGMGLVHDFMPNEKTLLTSRGLLFLKQEIGDDYVEDILAAKVIESQINIKKYLNKHLEKFIHDVTGKKVENIKSLIEQYSSEGNRVIRPSRKNNIYAPHALLLTMLKFACYEDDETDLLSWILAKHSEFKEILPEINIYDPDTAPDTDDEDESCHCCCCCCCCDCDCD